MNRTRREFQHFGVYGTLCSSKKFFVLTLKFPGAVKTTVAKKAAHKISNNLQTFQDIFNCN